MNFSMILFCRHFAETYKCSMKLYPFILMYVWYVTVMWQRQMNICRRNGWFGSPHKQATSNLALPYNCICHTLAILLHGFWNPLKQETSRSYLISCVIPVANPVVKLWSPVRNLVRLCIFLALSITETTLSLRRSDYMNMMEINLEEQQQNRHIVNKHVFKRFSLCHIHFSTGFLVRSNQEK